MRWLRSLLVAALTCTAASCSSPFASDDRVCPLVGCTSGLTIRFETAPPAGPVRVELLPTGASGPRYVVECGDGSGCPVGAVFPDFTGDYVLVRVTTSRGTFTREVRPTYAESRPNGPDCPPVCRNASVTVSMPA